MRLLPPFENTSERTYLYNLQTLAILARHCSVRQKPANRSAEHNPTHQILTRSIQSPSQPTNQRPTANLPNRYKSAFPSQHLLVYYPALLL